MSVPREDSGQRRRPLRMARILSATLLLMLPAAAMTPGPAPMRAPQEAFGVYARLLDAPGVPFDDVVAAVRSGLSSAGFEIVGETEEGVNRDACDYRAYVLAFMDEDYTSRLLAQGSIAAFALPLRAAVFEDENGVHVTMANPRSLNRTIVSEDAVNDLSAAIVEKVRAAVAGQGVGQAASGEYGQMRSRGLIGKTMGVMAGGPFPSKREGLQGGGEWKWGLHAVYGVTLPEFGTGIVGIGGRAMEARSFSIVGEGSNRSRAKMACPGIDHAAAYPVELVLTEVDGQVKVSLVDEMFRMKIYFEDAGKMKFAMNMRMPGSIESEIRDKVDEVLFQ